MYNFLLFENLCFAIYTIYIIIFKKHILNYDIVNAIASLYKTTNYTNIFVRYLYLYIASKYIPYDNYYMYILHLPQIYNSYIEPLIEYVNINVTKLIKMCFKFIYIYIFYLTIRNYPETSKIDSKYLYWNINSLYNSDIYVSTCNIIFMFILKILRMSNYPSYKLYKYLYYYKYKFHYESEFHIDIYNYFNYNIVIAGYYKLFIDTPQFAYCMHNMLPTTFKYLIYNYYIFNILECCYQLCSSYYFLNIILLNILITITDISKMSYYVYWVRCIMIILMPSLWICFWMLITDDMYTFLKLMHKKYIENNNLIRNKTEKVVMDENFFK